MRIFSYACWPSVWSILNWDIYNMKFRLLFICLSCCCCLVTKSCSSLCNSINSSPPGSSVCGISQMRIVEWVVLPFCRESSRPWDQTHISCIAADSLWLSHQGSPSLYLPSMYLFPCLFVCLLPMDAPRLQYQLLWWPHFLHCIAFYPFIIIWAYSLSLFLESLLCPIMSVSVSLSVTYYHGHCSL